MFRRDYLKKPSWLKIKLPAGDEFAEVFKLLKKYNLSTVCQEARCPNINECWAKKSATIMILGKICTRACRFCAVASGDPGGVVDSEEPEHVAEVVKKLGLKYVVVTSVDRDDLEDFGSNHYARTIKCIKEKNPQIKVEALIPDFSGREEYLKNVTESAPFVIGHNIETVRRLTPYIRDRRCSYEGSLTVLRTIKKLNDSILTKSGFMLGLGEKRSEVIETLKELKESGVDIITIGQYLQPTKKHHYVQKYYTPEEFDEFKKIGEELGVKYVISGPLVRSSYHAAEIF
ncbi:MAG TPA: lipoyl synthase [candidate division WOR-3 bacterium]|uniref:Lipoyl synthase n=1 Tax=candidate division WOR-3 bacterium TaxID=2052148 RepID=A0A9C9K0S9_UNCW3|nr:lipoyl synthase [candidate division WOR-3 bacterium]